MRSRLTFFIVAIAILLGSGQTARSLPRRTLSFAERVAYQYAIEEVYWHHRIWPRKGGENPRPKPALDEVMSRAQIEKKVADYLRNSQLLADQLQRPITSGDLQAEMYRIASHTKQPEVLREIFAALGNDSFVIAECVARPILAERLVSVRNDVEAFVSNDLALAAASAPTAKYTLPEISVPLDCTDDTWTPTTLTNALDARSGHTAVWTGSEMIVWAGYFFDFSGHFFNTGARYSPSTDSWTATSVTNAPDARSDPTAVWTGSQMIVWGGTNDTGYLNTGGRYSPTTNSWIATSITNAPAARDLHTAVWTGSEMIVWGGQACCTSDLNTGGRYNPGTNSWLATNTNNAPNGRERHTAVWTGSQMIIWGGYGSVFFNTGGRYNPSTDSWTATTTINAPNVRYEHTAVWTGSEMIVWGGAFYDGALHYLNTGGRYNPNTDSWTATSLINAPAAREYHTPAWTGSQMIVWGGYGENPSDSNAGGRYSPSSDSWTATSAANAPERPTLSHHGVDWQPNDCMGRIRQQRQLCQHRRQILCAAIGANCAERNF